MQTAAQVVAGEIPREPPAFVERETLARLAEAARPGRAAVVYAVTGLRGVGKTQLAAAYARDQISRGWGLVGWVNTESRDSLLGDLARIAEAAGVGDPNGDSAESARRLRDHLAARPGESLLVFDNAASPDLVRPFLPAAGGTHVVITSTSWGFAELGAVVDVGAFSRAESVGYLTARTGLDDPAGAGEVAAELGGLPLGLAQAAAVIAGQHLAYREYLERLRRVPAAKLLGRVPGGDYPHAAAAALLLNVSAAEDRDPSGLTGRLLRVVGVLSAEGVRRRLLDGLADGEQAAVGAAAQRCADWSLLAWSATGDAVIMHRLLARVLRERDQAASQLAATLEMALDLLQPQLFGEGQAWARREEGADLAAQAEAIWQAGADCGDPGLAKWMLAARSWAVHRLITAADLTRATDLGESVLADYERVLGPDHPDTLGFRNNLAYAYEEAGRLAEAITLHQRTLADSERVLGADHPDTLTSRNNLAGAYEEAGRLAEAIPLYQRTLANCEQVLGPDHPNTLSSRNNLAGAYEEAGRLAEAIPLLERTLADRERVLGADHPDTLRSRGNLAAAYESAGRIGEAMPLYERTLADSVRVLGADHPDTLTCRSNIAVAYALAGRLAEAIPLLERTLADRERVLGADHPDTHASKTNLDRARRRAVKDERLFRWRRRGRNNRPT
jgi:tetratricopeptide (TPR) repeat protein